MSTILRNSERQIWRKDDGRLYLTAPGNSPTQICLALAWATKLKAADLEEAVRNTYGEHAVAPFVERVKECRKDVLSTFGRKAVSA
jgi:hypothetical protein